MRRKLAMSAPAAAADNGEVNMNGSSKVAKGSKEKKGKKDQKASKQKGSGPKIPRQEPAWLFPPDEKNPVLNPVTKSKEQERKEETERLDAIDYLKHHATQAAHKRQPPALLLDLVGSFLASYGFTSTGRIYTTERQARVKMLGWNDPVGKQKLDPKAPTLVQIYTQWLAAFGKDAKMLAPGVNGHETGAGSDATSSDSESSSSDSDSDSENESDSDNDSDASAKEKKAASKDTGEGKVKSTSKETKVSTVATTPEKATVASLVNKIKRKAEPETLVVDSLSDSDSPSASKSSVEKPRLEPAATITQNSTSSKPKPAVIGTEASDSESNDSSDSSDSSDSDSDVEPKPVINGTSKTQPQANGHIDLPASKKAAAETKPDNHESEDSSSSDNESDSDSDSDSSSDSDSDTSIKAAPKTETSPPPKTETSPPPKAAVEAPAVKRKRSASPAEEASAPKKTAKKDGARFQRIPSDTKVDEKFSSNAYQPYDYANRAYQDLSVTRGKGFTKEKNKKKRGS